MRISALHNSIVVLGIVVLFFLLVPSSCGLKKDESGGVLARVGENYLYAEDVDPLLGNGTSKQDSAT
ncbi:MAG: hypothetical protein ACR2MT_18745, partial [Aurantibacter sp.]